MALLQLMLVAQNTALPHQSMEAKCTLLCIAAKESTVYYTGHVVGGTNIHY